jgi:CheY-like chemotaxis protein
MDEYIRFYGNHNKKKVLVVDDSGAMLRNVKGWLEDSYQVILANSGTMAIKYLSTNRPDLVLLDYEMPVVNGKQVLEMIRTENEFRDIPVMFLTGKNDRESIEQVMSLKPEGYILKTTKPEQIVQMIDEFFERRKTI